MRQVKGMSGAEYEAGGDVEWSVGAKVRPGKGDEKIKRR